MAQAIENARHEQHLTLEEAAERTSISRALMTKIMGGHIPGHETIKLIANGLGMDENRLLLLAGIGRHDDVVAGADIQEATDYLLMMNSGLRKRMIAGLKAIALSDKSEP